MKYISADGMKYIHPDGRAGWWPKDGAWHIAIPNRSGHYQWQAHQYSTREQAIEAIHTKSPKSIREEVLALRTEVNCRIEHGSESGGHLEHVQEQLDAILKTHKEDA